MYSSCEHERNRSSMSTALRHSRTCCMVIIGMIFLTTNLAREKPQTQHRQRYMMMPVTPISHLIIRQTAFALRAAETLLDPIGVLDHPSVRGKVRIRVAQRQVIIEANIIRFFTPLTHDQCLFVSALYEKHRVLDLYADTALDQLHRQEPLCPSRTFTFVHRLFGRDFAQSRTLIKGRSCSSPHFSPIIAGASRSHCIPGNTVEYSTAR